MPSPKQACWESIIAEWEASGQSQKAFCEARGLVFPTFAYWRQRIISAAEASSQPVAVACYEVQPATPLVPDIRSHSICWFPHSFLIDCRIEFLTIPEQNFQIPGLA